MTDKKMTYEEISSMFGGEIPAEAITFVFHSAPPDMTVREVRNELEEMAERHRASRGDLQNRLADIFLGAHWSWEGNTPSNFMVKHRDTAMALSRLAITFLQNQK